MGIHFDLFKYKFDFSMCIRHFMLKKFCWGVGVSPSGLDAHIPGFDSLVPAPDSSFPAKADPGRHWSWPK